ncbi:MAG: helix-turn-helix transcriptional regulator [Methylovulum sp.]|nr:helix-turn-helix transcriptional regulator [Methylovulum sp.]
MNTIRLTNLQVLAKKYASQRALADALDFTPGYINQLLTQKRSIGEKIARKIEGQLSLPPFCLDQKDSKPLTIESNAEFIGGFDEWDHTTPLGDDEVELPFFKEVELSAGTGKFHVEENHGAKLRFSKALLKSKGIAYSAAACVRVSGDSMEPIIPSGTTVGIDTANTRIVDGNMYAIDHGGHLRIKRLYRLPGGIIRINSRNPDYPDEFYDESEGTMRVIGRLFWYSVLL